MSELPTQLKHWDFDPKGLSKENLIEKEGHYISAKDPHSALVSPQYGPFYSATLYTADGVEIDSSNYLFGERVPELVGVVEKPLYHNIIIKGYESQTIYVSYQIPGGEFTRIKHQMLGWLVSKLNEPITTNWDRVTDVPHKLPVFAHRHYWLDFKNTDLIRETLNAFTASVEGDKLEDVTSVIEGLNHRLGLVENRLTGYMLHDHVNDAVVNNQTAHGLTAADISAEIKGSKAKTSDLIYGLSYLAFLTELRGSALNWKKLKDYIRVNNVHSFEGDLVTEGGIDWGTNISDSLEVNSLLRLGSSTRLEFGAEGALLNLTPNSVDFNGHKLYDWWSALEFSSTQEGSYSISIQSTDFDVSGRGTADNPVSLDLRYVPATEATPGFVQLSNAYSVSSDGWGITSFAAKNIENTITDYLPGTTTINGHRIGKDIVITKADVGLGEVDDTSDVNKPLSDAQIAEINKLSTVDHKHDWDTLSWEDAAPGNPGIDFLSTEFLDVRGAVSGALAHKYSKVVDGLYTEYEKKANDQDLVWTYSTGVVYTKHELGVDVTAGKVIVKTKSATKEYSVAGTSLKHLTGTGDVNTFGVYVTIVDESAQIKADWPGRTVKPTDILLFTYKKTDSNRSYSPRSIVDYGNSTNLREHLNEVSPHNYNRAIEDLVYVVNRGLVRTIDRGESFVWLPDGISRREYTEYIHDDCVGLVSYQPGNTPLRWKAVIGGQLIYQSSFAVVSNVPACINMNKVPFDVIVGYDVSDELLRSINIRMENGFTPRITIERYTYSRNQLGNLVPSVGSHTQLNYTVNSQEVYNLEEPQVAHFRFYFNAHTNELRFEMIGAKHIVVAATLTGLTAELRDELIQLMETGYTGIKTQVLSKLTVSGSVRAPHPNTENEINDYRGLFNSYISPAAIEEARHANREFVADYEFNCYYDFNYDGLVFEDVASVLPPGYNVFDATLINIDRMAGPVERELDERKLYSSLSMGVLSKTKDWFDGYAGNLGKYKTIIVPFLPKQYIEGQDGPIEVTEFIQHNERFKVKCRIRCAYTLWAVSATDWSYLSKHMATAPVSPEQPDFEAMVVLNGLESVQLN